MKNHWTVGEGESQYGSFLKWFRRLFLLTGRHLQKQAKEKSIEKSDTAEKADKEQKKGKKDSKAKAAKEWNNDDLTLLIDMLESKPCLWDIYYPDYLKRDMKEIGYSEIATALNMTNASVKTKINGLRAQLGDNKRKDNQERSEYRRVIQKQLGPLW